MLAIMMRLVQTLALAVAASAAAILALTFDQGSPGRVAAGLVLVLILPGLAALAAMHPSRRLGAVRVPLTLGLSLSVVALVGLVLNWFESGLDRTNWAIALAAVIALLTSIGAVRRTFDPVRRRPRRSARAFLGTWLPVAATLVPATVIAGVALARSADSDAHRPRPGFTAIGASYGASNRAYLWLTSYEHKTVSYRLRADVGGQVLIDRSYPLSPGESIATTIRLPSARAWDKALIKVYRGNDPAPYRRLTLVSRHPR